MQKLIIRFFVSFHFDPGLDFYHDFVVMIAGVESSSLFAKNGRMTTVWRLESSHCDAAGA